MKKISLGVWLLIIFVAIVFGLSVYKRYWQLSVWAQNKEATSAKDGTISMTTLDAYHWTRLAKEYRSGNFGKDKIDPLREYPDRINLPKRPTLLVFLLAKLSPMFGGSIHMTGIYMIPILASLFIIPLTIYFYQIGFGLSGLAGGLFGTFSYAYYIRSCNGRVDTDALNLFFPIAISLFFLLITKTDKQKLRYIYAGIAGILMLFFNWWYEHEAFTVVYLVVLIVTLLVYRFKGKEVAILSVIFIIFSNPVALYNGFGGIFDFIFKTGYFNKQSITLANISWPNIMETISESNRRKTAEVLSMIAGSPKIAVIGVAGILAAVIWRFKQMIPLLPMLILGALAFKSGNRFAMYLTPLAWVGVGFLIYLATHYTVKYFKRDEKITHIVVPLIILALFVASNNIKQPLTAYNVVLPPSIPTQIVNGFIDIKAKVPKASPVFTWWDFGYALMDIGEFSTYHDGGNHGADKSYFNGKAFVLDNQRKMYNLISAIDHYKFKGINKMLDDNKSANKVVEALLNYQGKPENGNILILYTYDMIDKFGAISYFGNWDFETKTTNPLSYQMLNCSEISSSKLTCENASVDIERGLINNQIPVKRIVFVQNGQIEQKIEYPYDSDINIELLSIGRNIIAIYALSNRLYNSNFNQMYLLGVYDNNLYEEIYNNYPVERAFRVKK
jgi:dolichyl-diphosphooligosaccharide--protein glycosyltransferase